MSQVRTSFEAGAFAITFASDHAPVSTIHFHRIHFLMSGFVRYNLKSSDPDESQHAGAKINNADTDDRGLPQGLQLELRFCLLHAKPPLHPFKRCSKDLVSLHQCSVEIRPTEPSLQR